MDKTRRKMLNTISLGGILTLSGCLDVLRTPRVDYTTDEQISISIPNVAQNPDTSHFDLDFNVEIIKRNADADGPPVISVSIENTGDSDVILMGKTRALFGGEIDTTRSVLLLTNDELNEDQIKDTNCWSLKDDIPRSGTDYETTLRGGNQSNIELNIIGNANTDNCIPTGEYRFDTDYAAYLPDDSGNQLVEEFTWGFILDILMEDI